MSGLLESKQKRIVVVEDDDRERRVMVRGLEREGYLVRDAASGEEALSLFESEVPELMITDLCMPGMGGVALMQKVKARWPDTEVLVVTGRPRTSSAVEALRAGAFDYIRKPISRLDDLVRRARQALMQQSLRRHNGQLVRKMRAMHEELRKVAVSRTQELSQRTERFQGALARSKGEQESARRALANLVIGVSEAMRAIHGLANDLADTPADVTVVGARIRAIAAHLDRGLEGLGPWSVSPAA